MKVRKVSVAIVGWLDCTGSGKWLLILFDMYTARSGIDLFRFIEITVGPWSGDYEFIFWYTSNGKDQRCHLQGRDVGTAKGIGIFYDTYNGGVSVYNFFVRKIEGRPCDYQIAMRGYENYGYQF